MDIYLVGGAVRDQLLGLAVEERDWVVVGASAGDLLAQGFRQVGRDFPVFLHPDTGEEYALARTERKSGSGHHGFTVHSAPSVTLEEDLQRRDLTINAMAMDDSGVLVDPYGGRRDLDQGLLRHVSPAFVEDPLRVLRVARFAARLAHRGFEVHPDTLALMRAIVDSGELATLPAERTWNEFAKALEAPHPARFLEVLDACGAGDWLLPGLENRTQAIERLTGVASHSTTPEVRFAALFHGTGSLTRSVSDTLKPPRRFAELAVLVATLGEAIGAFRSLDAAGRLSVLEQADAFRRPERFERLLECCQALGMEGAGADFWRSALAACAAVDSRELVAGGLRGEAVGRELRKRREAAIAGLSPG